MSTTSPKPFDPAERGIERRRGRAGLAGRQCGALAAIGCAWALGVSVQGFAAETADPAPMTKTWIVFSVDAAQPLPIRTSFQERPPAIIIEFLTRQVIGSMPERIVVGKGVVQTVQARYAASSGPKPVRSLQAVQIGLSGPYTYRATSEVGRVVIEIDHPSTVGSAAVEIALKSGTMKGALHPPRVSERFQAMQEALTVASGARGLSLAPPLIPETARASTAALTPEGRGGTSPVFLTGRRAPQPRLGSTGLQPAIPPRAVRSASRGGWFFWSVLAILGVGLTVWGMMQRGRFWRLRSPFRHPREEAQRPPAGVVLVEQLAWRALERQGYQLLLETELTRSPVGILRVAVKDGVRSAILFVGNGSFFEKQTVERFIQVMQDVKVERGMLIAAGSFTVPAQRAAKAQQITLIGRDELVELLSAGAGSEYFAKELQTARSRLDEASGTLQQYAEELDALRRQRNEASWYLGEERAKSAKLEAQWEETARQLRAQEADLHRGEQDAETWRKQWEESEWYLGESRSRLRHLEGQLTVLQDVAKRVEAAERTQAEASWYLGEERAKSEQFTAQLGVLQRQLEETEARERALQAQLAQLQQTLHASRSQRGRRTHARVAVPQAFVELYHGGTDQPMFAGVPRDLSCTGIGLETDQELPSGSPVQVRLSGPGREPIASEAEVVWQKSRGTTGRHQSGFRLTESSDSVQEAINQLLESQSASAR